MFDITKIHQIINHLKAISNYYKETNNEIITFCNYCDDSTRHKADHGHLYISKSSPVFHCFRCSASGTLIRFLIDSGFEDQEVLTYLSQFIKYRTVKDYYKIKKTVPRINQIKERVIKLNLEFEQNDFTKYKIFTNYLKSRLGNVNMSDFLISPMFFYEKLSCLFTNSENEDVVLRLIEPYKDIRYHLFQETSGRYYFQDVDFDKYHRVVLTEGPFDMLSLYLYSDEFKDCFFISLNGKKYSSALEWLILEYFLIDHLEVNFVFDNDVTKYRTYLFRAKTLAKNYNENIIIRGWRPIIGKDTGDFPGIVEL